MLEFNLPTILLEIANFLLLTLALYYFLFRSVMKRVDERAKRKDQLEQQMTEDRAKAAQLREDWEERLAKIEEEVAQIVQSAREQLEAERQDILDETLKQAERILEETRTEAKRMQAQEVRQFYGEVLDAIFTTSAELISRAAPEEVHNALVKQAHARIWELGKKDIRAVETLRRSLGDRLPTVFAETARELTPEQQHELARTFTALADRDVNVEVNVNPALASGIRVRLGDIVVNGTIADQLESLREQVDKSLQERLEYVV